MQAVENDVAVAPFAGAWIEIFVAGASFSHALVAPFAGAWIEILTSALKPGLVETSHPSRVRGLKSFTMDACRPSTIVAPFAGAWIEIKLALEQIYQDNVAPFAGAWIEIPNLIPVTASK